MENNILAMPKKTDHTFYCEKCKSGCMIYKKGKKHRVLVCPNCGVLATNGLFSKLAKGAMKIGKSVPLLGTALSIGETAYDIVKGDGESKPTTSSTPSSYVHKSPRNAYTTHQRVSDALRR